MNRMGDSKEKFIEEDLLQYCKIVDMDSNGVTSVKQENLGKILNAIDSLKFQENTPSAVIALTGPNEQAKFILLNFLFDALEGKGVKTRQQLAAIKHLDWSHSHRANNSASIQRFLNVMEAGSNQGEANSEGIFLWPEPFHVKNRDEKQVAIWIMNVCRKKATNSEELEEITAVLSSKVMTLECFSDNICLKVLGFYGPIPVPTDTSYPEPIYWENICYSCTDEFPCNPLFDAIEHITDIQISINAMKNLNAAKIINKILKTIVNAIIKDTVVVPSPETEIDGLHALSKIGSMKKAITSVVKKSNEHRQQREKCRLVMEKCLENASKQIEGSFPRFSETWMKTQFSMSTKQEILEVYTYLKKQEILEQFKDSVHKSLWKEFNELVDGRCKIELVEILKHYTKSREL